MDFRSLLDRYHVKYHATGKQTRRGWLNLRCPWCGRDPYMGYNLRGRYVHCWNCGRQDLIGTVRRLTGLDLSAVVALIGELPRELDHELRPVGELTRPGDVRPLGLAGAHRQYLLERGGACGAPDRFDWRKLDKVWDVRAIGQFGGPVRWSLYLPIHLYGEEVSWTTRTIVAGVEPRYRSARDEESKVSVYDLLYGFDLVGNGVVVHEGPLDAIATGPGAVATMRTSPSPAQIARLSRIPVRAVCFDDEPDAQARARKLCDQLSVYDGTTTNVVLQSAKDAAAADERELVELRKLFLE